jgi:hypothetical protein
VLEWKCLRLSLIGYGWIMYDPEEEVGVVGVVGGLVGVHY